jgi:hypothetical protein
LIASAESDLPQLDEMAGEMAAALKKSGNAVELVKCRHRNHITIITRFATAADPLHKAFRDFVQKNSK